MSLRITNSMMSRLTLADIEKAADQMSKTQQKLASGKELTKPSDNPYAVTRALDLRSSLAENAQFQTNVREATAWHDVTDTALSHVGDYVQRARDLLIRGSNDSLGPDARKASADEIDQIVEALKGEANAQYAGRYVFSGTKTQTPPYVAGGADTYNGDNGTIKRAIGAGVTIPVNATGPNVIGDGTTGLIKDLRTIAADLRAGNTAALQGTDIKAIDAAHDQLLTQRAAVGARASRLEAAGARLQQVAETQNKILSDTEDADMAKTMVDYSMQSSVYQAALKAGAQIIQPSLMDFLH
jgi:flagellar hook-associated protein 3 FlgL